MFKTYAFENKRDNSRNLIFPLSGIADFSLLRVGVASCDFAKLFLQSVYSLLSVITELSATSVTSVIS